MSEDRARTPAGDLRLTREHPDLAARMAKWGHQTTDLIPGFRVTYRELDNICQLLRDDGWSGFIGLDEAVEAYVRPARRA